MLLLCHCSQHNIAMSFLAYVASTGIDRAVQSLWQCSEAHPIQRIQLLWTSVWEICLSGSGFCSQSQHWLHLWLSGQGRSIRYFPECPVLPKLSPPKASSSPMPLEKNPLSVQGVSLPGWLWLVKPGMAAVMRYFLSAVPDAFWSLGH